MNQKRFGKLKYFVAACAAVALGLWLWRTADRPVGAGPLVDVKVPELSPLATRGETAFKANCAPCHGKNAAGSNKGPPLVHDIYNPGHHADGSFFIAAKRGVRSHHWRYGDMPPQPQVTDGEMAAIVRFVRELQAANGIGDQPHRM
jgi:mono/diheme cytochrome c family protein